MFGSFRKVASIALVFAAVLAIVLPTEAAFARKSHVDLSPIEQLGKDIFFDKSLSEPRGQACAACHAPTVGFTGPSWKTNAGGAVYEGAVKGAFGNRKPPAAAYAGDSPVFGLSTVFSGGMFWDGRATGWTLGDPLAEQAMGPFLNPKEQNNPSAAAVVMKVQRSNYARLFLEVWGPNAFDDSGAAYVMIARSIAAYERSAAVSPFNSRFDHYLETGTGLTNQELAGLALFNGKAKCANCHVSSGANPTFTDYTYDNIGSPKNPKNPQGPAYTDPGLGGFLATTAGTAHDFSIYADANMGKFKVPTLRNVDKRPYKRFVKAYGHNGYFKSLDEIVHFYNTRDLPSAGWPAPETVANMNTTEVGDLGLTPAEEKAIVAFLKTLSDQ